MAGKANRWIIAISAVVIVLAGSRCASADAGIPMLAVLWPAAWLALLPVILIEGLVAKRVLDVDWWRALRLSAMGNVVSTTVGIPVAWLAMVAVQLTVGSAAEPLLFRPVSSGWARAAQFAVLPLFAPWLPPIEADEHLWVVPAAAIILCLGFFVVSVYVERWVVGRLLPSERAAEVRAWSWQANVLSYAAIETLLVLTLMASASGGKWPYSD